MKNQAASIIAKLTEAGLIATTPTIQEKAIQQTEQALQELDVLTLAVERELLFQSDNENLGLEKDDAESLAEQIVETGDWSHFNEWLVREINDYVNE